MRYHMLRSQNLPGLKVVSQIYVPEFGDETYIKAVVDEFLNSLPLAELCDSEGKFPEKIKINAVGKVERADKSRSKKPSQDFYKYVVGHFDTSTLRGDQKEWFDKAVKEKLKLISAQVKKANRPKKVVKKPTAKKSLSDRERQQKKFDRIAKIVEKANAEKNTPVK